jgi:hypothetical protein
VRVRFDASYDHGIWVNRTAWVDRDRFKSHDGSATGDHEVAVSWTDNHGAAIQIHRNIDVCFLIPCRPSSRTQEILIVTPGLKTLQGAALEGVHQPYQCKTSSKEVVLSYGHGKKEPLSFEHVVVVQREV